MCHSNYIITFYGQHYNATVQRHWCTIAKNRKEQNAYRFFSSATASLAIHIAHNLDENCLSVGLSVTLNDGTNHNRCKEKPEILHRETQGPFKYRTSTRVDVRRITHESNWFDFLRRFRRNMPHHDASYMRHEHNIYILYAYLIISIAQRAAQRVDVRRRALTCGMMRRFWRTLACGMWMGLKTNGDSNPRNLCHWL